MADVPADQILTELPLSKRWAREYPPLLTMVIALLIAFLVLPSSLNLPNSNPTTVLEFAPVPPEDDDPPPDSGSLSTLGLGSSDSLSAESSEAPPPPLENQSGKGTRKSNKRCVGNPSRQTEDPNAPPCVSYFEGDNGGATWQGVTGSEIVALIYASSSIRTDGHETPPDRSYCDLDGPIDTQEGCLDSARQVEDHPEVRVSRAMSTYFNSRFQTYNRRVHFYIYWSPSSATPSSRKSEAVANWERLKPFSVLDRAFFGGYNQVYADAIARRNVSVFGTFSSLPNIQFRELAPFLWSFWPDVEHSVGMYVNYVCQRVAGFNVSFAGDDKQPPPDMNGTPRKFAYLSTDDPLYTGLQLFASLAKRAFEKPCPSTGLVIKDSVVADLTFPRHQYSTDTHPDAARVARLNIAEMRSAGVTTVLWLQGYETEHTKAARSATFYPEWVMAGDLLNDSINNARDQDQTVWPHAWMFSHSLREDRAADAPCRQAFREADPMGNQDDEDVACNVYRGFFMMFRSIQAAGPRLSPNAVDQGNHAIPRQASKNPSTAACFFDPSDYSCVKDGQESWWDATAPDPGGDSQARGCWKMVTQGRRYLAEDWPRGQGVFQNRNDVCNSVESDSFINPYGPAG